MLLNFTLTEISAKALRAKGFILGLTWAVGEVAAKAVQGVVLKKAYMIGGLRQRGVQLLKIIPPLTIWRRFDGRLDKFKKRRTLLLCEEARMNWTRMNEHLTLAEISAVG